MVVSLLFALLLVGPTFSKVQTVTSEKSNSAELDLFELGLPELASEDELVESIDPYLDENVETYPSNVDKVDEDFETDVEEEESTENSDDGLWINSRRPPHRAGRKPHHQHGGRRFIGKEHLPLGRRGRKPATNLRRPRGEWALTRKYMFLRADSFAWKFDQDSMDQKLDYVCHRIQNGPMADKFADMDLSSKPERVQRKFERQQEMRMCCRLDGEEQRRDCFTDLMQERVDEICTAETSSRRRPRFSLDTLKTSCCPLEGEDRYNCFNQSWSSMYGRWAEKQQSDDQIEDGEEQYDLEELGRNYRTRGGLRRRNQDHEIDHNEEGHRSRGKMNHKRRGGPHRGRNQQDKENREESNDEKKARRQMKISCCRAGQASGESVTKDRWPECSKSARIFTKEEELRSLDCKIAFKRCCIKNSIIINPPPRAEHGVVLEGELNPEAEVDGDVEETLDLETLLLIDEEDQLTL